MKQSSVREAWVRIPSEEERRSQLPPGAPASAYGFEFIPAMARLLAAHDKIGPALGALLRQIMFEPGYLSRQEREMIAAVASAAQDCHYWMQSHAEFLRVENGDPALVEAIKHKRWRELPGLSPRERALCSLAEKLSAMPMRMVEQDWQPLRDLGFDDRVCLEVAHIVGLFNYLTRLADGFGLQLDASTQGAARTGIALKRPSKSET